MCDERENYHEFTQPRFTTALPKWCGTGLRTADAAGGRVLVYSNLASVVGARTLRRLANSTVKRVVYRSARNQRLLQGLR